MESDMEEAPRFYLLNAWIMNIDYWVFVRRA